VPRAQAAAEGSVLDSTDKPTRSAHHPTFGTPKTPTTPAAAREEAEEAEMEEAEMEKAEMEKAEAWMEGQPSRRFRRWFCFRRFLSTEMASGHTKAA